MFTSPNEIEVNGQRITFTKACIATGSKPKIPKVSGLEENDVPYHTTETIFSL